MAFYGVGPGLLSELHGETGHRNGGEPRGFRVAQLAAASVDLCPAVRHACAGGSLEAAVLGVFLDELTTQQRTVTGTLLRSAGQEPAQLGTVSVSQHLGSTV